ncbi:MAG: hypothetical protein KC505_03000 [Myxococcales bacterium]|nr:hypothetical protein [Myxococcales bacterium]USN51717.1 MAG: hypothetical protein H6731_04730 [Myxococcales bacterium]
MLHEQEVRINPYVVNSLYLVLIPIAVLMIVDLVVFSGYFKTRSPLTLEFVLWLNLFLNFPHIICSSLLLADKKYLSFFKDKLLYLAIFGIFAVFILVAFDSAGLREAVTLFALIWTVKHVIGQQFSMTKIFLKRKENLTFKIWKSYGVFISSSLFLCIYSRIYTNYFSYLKPFLNLFEQYSLYFTIPAIVLSAILLFQVRESAGILSGKLMIVGNLCMVLVSCFLFSQDYFSLAVLGPRIIHDFSALYFYGAHSYNKKKVKKSGSFFDFIHRNQPIPLFFASSLLGCGLMYFCQNIIFDLTIYHALSALHFYTESFFWKADSPAREFLHF